MVTGEEALRILEELRRVHGEGVYPGRSDGMDTPSWRRDPFHTLIATVLSQRTRDENTRAAADSLFSALPEAADIAAAGLEDIEALIRKAGFPAQKAKAVKEISRRVLEEHGGEVPADIDALLSLPMVGRKTANCVLAYAFGIPAICVDTHVHRISNLMGLVESSNADGTEEALKDVFPPALWRDVNAFMVRHGQVICLPRRPRCSECPVRSLCDHGRGADRK